MRGRKDSLNEEANNFTVFMRNGKEEEEEEEKEEEDKGQAKGEAYLYVRHVVTHAYLLIRASYSIIQQMCISKCIH